MPVVTSVTFEGLQRQYGTVKAAIIRYLDDDMPPEQQAALERAVPPEYIAAIAQTRLFQQLVRGSK